MNDFLRACEGKVDGATLIDLFLKDDAEATFTALYPEGIGLTRLQFKGRFTTEMRKRNIMR